MEKPVGLMPAARVKAIPVSGLCMYSDVHAPVLFARVSEFILAGLPKRASARFQFFEIGKNEVLKNYHKVVEAGARPSPGLESADFRSSAVGLEATVFISHAFAC